MTPEPARRLIDLRSDTVTRPDLGMRQAMAAAEVGDDVYGEDPTVRALEARVAALLGHEAALFTATGSMANLLGVSAHVQGGGELLCEARAHVVRAELGAHAAVGGVTTRTWRHPRGLVDLEAIAELLEPDAGPYFVSTAAVSVENTHNFGGGSIQPLGDLKALRELTAASGVAVHLDGARLWNAHVASGIALDEYGRLADTVSVCFSKGLGAPVGSALAGPADLIAAARLRRKRWGGGMRQAGVLAAAAAYALDVHLDTLAEDHVNAQVLARTVAAAAPGLVEAGLVETNIVVLNLGGTKHSSSEVLSAARARGVLVGSLGPQTVRAVTHHDLSAQDVERAADVLVQVLG